MIIPSLKFPQFSLLECICELVFFCNLVNFSSIISLFRAQQPAWCRKNWRKMNKLGETGRNCLLHFYMTTITNSVILYYIFPFRYYPFCIHYIFCSFIFSHIHLLIEKYFNMENCVEKLLWVAFVYSSGMRLICSDYQRVYCCIFFKFY